MAGTVPDDFSVQGEGSIDFWYNPHPWDEVDPDTGTLKKYRGPREREDVILNNVIGFDVKVWDPMAREYKDLGYGGGSYDGTGMFNHLGTPQSGLEAQANGPRTYCTWSFHYEQDGINQDEDDMADEGTNGFDDDGSGGVDDVGELETLPPYPVPLRGIQVKIRVFDPDSRSIREVTVVQDFLPK